MGKDTPSSVSDYDKIQSKKQELAKRIADKSDVLKKVAKKYAPKERRAECDLARDVFYEAMEEYEEGEYTWSKFIEELSKSLKAIKK